jgi:hypothetical protein
MKHFLIGITAAVAAAVLSTGIWAQVLSPRQPQSPYADAYGYGIDALTPEDAYRSHQINRWELEQLTGQLPQALQGPSPNGLSDMGR